MSVCSVLNYLFFFSNRKKRMREIQKKIKTGKINVREDDPLEMFVSSTEIRYCYYSETHKILGNTYGMCILQVSLYIDLFNTWGCSWQWVLLVDNISLAVVLALKYSIFISMFVIISLLVAH